MKNMIVKNLKTGHFFFLKNLQSNRRDREVNNLNKSAKHVHEGMSRLP